jgi:methyl-accepting chemotaxis protein
VVRLLGALGEMTRGVEKITDDLSSVAVQTKMLAVSGAVEATRAGDAGRGFETVARDIRKLASEAAGNASEVKDVVRSIHDQMVIVRSDLDQMIGASESELARNRAITDRFIAIVSDLELTRATNDAVLLASEDMLRSVREVREGTRQIAQAAEMASGASREAAGAARQQTQSAEVLAATIEDIASLANALAAESA